ncbi:MAG: hypothetical protein LBJ08_05075 [Bifidobacteriaceae bacterium]|jgi:N-acetylglucosamine kinase-like BadF-type ATPase|nr:hypothetical protein [Bifidobacteriaceae bacterium]
MNTGWRMDPGVRLLALDVGATKIHALAEGGNGGQHLFDRVYPNAGWSQMTGLKRAERLRGLVESVSQKIGPLTAIVAGVHGIDADPLARIFAEVLKESAPVLHVTNDSGLVVPAAGLDTGIGVIAGTGSSVTLHRCDGRVRLLGGWGWVLGDDGGASGLVKALARHCLKIQDAGGADEATDLLVCRFGLEDAREFGRYMLATDARDWSNAASAVFDAARAGSAAAAAAIEDNIAGLVKTVAMAAMGDPPVSDIVCAGGVFANQAGYFRDFGARVRDRLGERYRVQLLRAAPVQGGLAIARRLVADLSVPIKEQGGRT